MPRLRSSTPSVWASGNGVSAALGRGGDPRAWRYSDRRDHRDLARADRCLLRTCRSVGAERAGATCSNAAAQAVDTSLARPHWDVKRDVARKQPSRRALNASAATTHKPHDQAKNSRWRDPDSNRGHHDFQSYLSTPQNQPIYRAFVPVNITPIPFFPGGLPGVLDHGWGSWSKTPRPILRLARTGRGSAGGHPSCRGAWPRRLGRVAQAAREDSPLATRQGDA
jgi:hypothetical protein